MMIQTNKIVKVIFGVGYLLAQTSLVQASLFDPTFAGYGTTTPYIGSYVSGFLDTGCFSAATTPSDNVTTASSSPYGIVNLGLVELAGTLSGTTLPNYATTQFPGITRLNRSGSPDTTFGQLLPGTGYFLNDPTGTLFTASSTITLNKIIAVNGFYYIIDASTAGQFTISRYLPTSGSMDAVFNAGITTFTLYKADGATTVPGAVVTGVCVDQTTSKFYVSYGDGTDAYIAAFAPSTSTYPLAPFAYVVDTTFNTTGVVALTAATVAAVSIGTTTVTFSGIGFDDYTNAVVAIGDTDLLQLVIARFNVGGDGGQFSLLTSGSGTGANPAFTAANFSYILPKYAAAIEGSASTPLYYLVGFAATNTLQIMYFDPSTQALVENPGNPGVYFETLTTTNTANNYTPTDVIQILDTTGTKATAVVTAIHTVQNDSTILNFQLEDLTLDAGSNAYVVGGQLVAATAFGGTDTNASLYSAAFDAKVYISGQAPQGLVVYGNHTTATPATGAFFANYVYDGVSDFATTPAGNTSSITRTGTAVLDYEVSTYPGGFTFVAGFYSAVIAANKSYYIVANGNKGAGAFDTGIFRYDFDSNAFDMSFSGTAGNPFAVVAANCEASAAQLSGAIVYTAGVGTAGASPLKTTAFTLQATTGTAPIAVVGYGTAGVATISSLTGAAEAFSNIGMVVDSGAPLLVGVAATNAAQGFIARLSSTTGALDTNFSTDGYVVYTAIANSTLTSIVVDSNAKIVVAGNGTGANGGKIVVARYSAAGALDTTFNTTGYGAYALAGVSGAGYSTLVLNVKVDASNNVFVAGGLEGKLLVKGGGVQSGTHLSDVPFVQKITGSSGLVDYTFCNANGTFLLASEDSQQSSLVNMVLSTLLLDPNPTLSGLTVPGAGTAVPLMYGIGVINGQASVVRFGTIEQSGTTAAAGWQYWAFQ